MCQPSADLDVVCTVLPTVCADYCCARARRFQNQKLKFDTTGESQVVAGITTDRILHLHVDTMHVGQRQLNYCNHRGCGFRVRVTLVYNYAPQLYHLSASCEYKRSGRPRSLGNLDVRLSNSTTSQSSDVSSTFSSITDNRISQLQALGQRLAQQYATQRIPWVPSIAQQSITTSWLTLWHAISSSPKPDSEQQSQTVTECRLQSEMPIFRGESVAVG